MRWTRHLAIRLLGIWLVVTGLLLVVSIPVPASIEAGEMKRLP